MALNPKFSEGSADARCAAHTALLNTGKLRIYSGTQPADTDAGVGGGTLLSEHDFSATAFGAPANGVATANAISSEVILASGTAAWYRCVASNGTTVVEDGTVGTATSNLVLDSVALSSGATLNITAFTHTESRG